MSQLLIMKQSCQNGSGVRDAGGLDKHPLIGRYLTREAFRLQPQKRIGEISAYCATHAAIGEQYRGAINRLNQVMIKAYLTEFVDEHRGACQRR